MNREVKADLITCEGKPSVYFEDQKGVFKEGNATMGTGVLAHTKKRQEKTILLFFNLRVAQQNLQLKTSH